MLLLPLIIISLYSQYVIATSAIAFSSEIQRGSAGSIATYMISAWDNGNKVLEQQKTPSPFDEWLTFSGNGFEYKERVNPCFLCTGMDQSQNSVSFNGNKIKPYNPPVLDGQTTLDGQTSLTMTCHWQDNGLCFEMLYKACQYVWDDKQKCCDKAYEVSCQNQLCPIIKEC